MSTLALRFGCALLVAAAIPASAQFSQLAATDDGKQLYFTSQLLLKGATGSVTPAETRIYRYGADGVTLFAERGVLSPANSSNNGGSYSSSSSDGASGPQVSGDGSAVGFTFRNICASSTNCVTQVSAEGELRGKTTQDLGPGVLQLSRNGRWALLTVTEYGQWFVKETSNLIDLSTGQSTSIPSPSANITGRTVASDGTVLTQQNSTVGLWKQGQFTAIQFPIGLSLTPIALSDDASTLFLTGAVPGPGGLSAFRILAMNLASGKLTIVFQQKDSTQIPVFMGTSNNGQNVLYRYGGISTLNGPAFVFNIATGVSTPISLPSGELVSDGTLTGGGEIAFLATSAGRIVKVTLATGVVETVVPAVPHCDDLSMAVPGSFVRLHCNVTGPVSGLQGQILVNDVAMPILYVTASEIGAQIPWNVGSIFSGSLTLKTANSSPFQASQSLNLSDMAPSFEPADAGTSPLLGLKLVKGDWSGLLTSQPAPGDIFYAYMTGLGAVNGPMQTGVAAPLTAAEQILGSLTCQFAPKSSAATTLFAGLAPGTVGIYQVAFQLPAGAGSQPLSCMGCSWRGPYGGGGMFSQLCGGFSQTPALETQPAIMKFLPDDRRRQ